MQEKKRNSQIDDLTGRVYGQLTVLGFAGWSNPPSGSRHTKWNCKCSCGNEIVAYGTNLKKENHTTSCGCVHKQRTSEARKTHGLTNSPTYSSWLSMKERCTCVTSKTYPEYGGSGVVICARWLESFENFLEDMGERPEGTSINRIGSVPLYSKETCEWANRSIQGYDQKMKNTNTSGKTGVCWVKRSGKWSAQITKDYQLHHLGFFDNKEDAIEARKAAELKYFGWNK